MKSTITSSSSFPEHNSEERMKLAHWCLNQQMIPEAREQLTKVVALNPKNQQAHAMLISIDQTAAVAAMRRRDPEVRQTRGERVADDRPATLDSALIRGAQSALGISGLPVIFDLPKPLAVTRATEFAKYVHPLLQARCTRCHNENYDGKFQLVQYKTRADQTADALRANLDATLRLIDPNNLSRSELLSSTLRPHGRGPIKRPVFPGSNDRAYQVLESWVSQLRPPRPAGERPVLGQPGADNDQPEVFAAQRERISREHPEPRVQETPRPTPIRGSLAEDQVQASPQEFPLPFVISGSKPAIPPSGTSKRLADGPAAQPASGERSGTQPPARLTAAGAAINTDKAAATSDPKMPPEETPAREQTTAKSASKPLKLDPTLLRKVLQGRNTGH